MKQKTVDFYRAAIRFFDCASPIIRRASRNFSATGKAAPKKIKFKEVLFYGSSVAAMYGFYRYHENQYSLELTDQREEILKNIACDFAAGNVVAAQNLFYKTVYTDSAFKNFIPVIELIEKEDFIGAKKRADKIFSRHRHLLPYYDLVVKLLQLSIARSDDIFDQLVEQQKTGLYSFDKKLDSGAVKSINSYKNYAKKGYNSPLLTLGSQYYYLGSRYEGYQGDKAESMLNLARAENRVTIRVWLPQNSTDVGHVSLETHHHYLSFWPCEEKELLNLAFSKRGRHFMDSVSADIKYIGRLPDIRISFYALNSAELAHLIHEIKEKQDKIEWSFWGSSIFAGDSKNCVSIVTDILKKTLFAEIVNKRRLITTLSSVWDIAIYLHSSLIAWYLVAECVFYLAEKAKHSAFHDYEKQKFYIRNIYLQKSAILKATNKLIEPYKNEIAAVTPAYIVIMGVTILLYSAGKVIKAFFYETPQDFSKILNTVRKEDYNILEAAINNLPSSQKMSAKI